MPIRNAGRSRTGGTTSVEMPAGSARPQVEAGHWEVKCQTHGEAGLLMFGRQRARGQFHASLQVPNYIVWLRQFLNRKAVVGIIWIAVP